MDVSQLELPSLAECLSDAKEVWVKANRIGTTLRTWEQEEADIRERYAKFQAMTFEERDVAMVESHLEKVGMLEAVRKHINNVELPKARAREAAAAQAAPNRAARRGAKKKKRGQR